MKRILVLGGGRVGATMARDLHDHFHVCVADNNIDQLKYLEKSFGLSVSKLDSTDATELNLQVKNVDLVINALPGFLGFNGLKDLIEAGKNVVDISFFPEDAFLLNEAALKNDVSVVVDCGVAPGLCNIILGHHIALEKVNSYTCYVGGLPFERKPPFEYKAPFSPIDVIEEYIRPARYRIDGALIEKEALSDIENLEFENIGVLEAFNTDGLRTLLHTTDVKSLKEKTLRYPGHAEKMKLFRDSGMFGNDEILVKGKKVRPIDMTSTLLFDQWKLEEDDDEFTLMKILIEGESSTVEYLIYDETDKEKKMSSMSRTTGFTATAVARLLLDGNIKEKGILPPESIGKSDHIYTSVINDLKKRNVRISKVVL